MWIYTYVHIHTYKHCYCKAPVVVVVVDIGCGCCAVGIELCVFLCCSILTCGRKLLGLWPSTPGSGNTRSSTPNFSQPDSVILQVSTLYMKALRLTPGSSCFSIFTFIDLFICFIWRICGCGFHLQCRPTSLSGLIGWYCFFFPGSVHFYCSAKIALRYCSLIQKITLYTYLYVHTHTHIKHLKYALSTKCYNKVLIYLLFPVKFLDVLNYNTYDWACFWL